MALSRLFLPWRCVGVVVLAASLCAGLTVVHAEAQGFAGKVSYTGALGPVGAQRPLCLCLFADPELTAGLGCLIFGTNPATYQLSRLNRGDYYLVAFLDLHINERLDPDEPYEIYRDRSLPPADPVSATANPAGIDFIFADENLPATSSPTPTPSLMPTASPTDGAPTPSPTVPVGAADCDGNGTVAVDELVRAVAIALATLDLSACPAADPNGDGEVRIEELIAALNVALAGPTAVAARGAHVRGGAHGS